MFPQIDARGDTGATVAHLATVVASDNQRVALVVEGDLMDPEHGTAYLAAYPCRYDLHLELLQHGSCSSQLLVHGIASNKGSALSAIPNVCCSQRQCA